MPQDESPQLTWVAGIFPVLTIGVFVAIYVIGRLFFVSDDRFILTNQPVQRLPCSGDAVTECLSASGVRADNPNCAADERRVCLMPLGQTSEELVSDLVAYFDGEYGLQISVMSSKSVPRSLVDSTRNQIDGQDLIGRMTAGPEPRHSHTVILGLTPLDLYTKDENWRFELGERGTYENPIGVISTFRMYLGSAEPAEYGLVLERAHKMLERYVGYLYYGLDVSDDPHSPLRSSILSVGDLDEISEKLPVGRQTHLRASPPSRYPLTERSHTIAP